MIGGKRLRIYYMAQVDIEPPKFILFVNSPHLMSDTYKKYLYNQFRETYRVYWRSPSDTPERQREERTGRSHPSHALFPFRK